MADSGQQTPGCLLQARAGVQHPHMPERALCRPPDQILKRDVVGPSILSVLFSLSRTSDEEALKTGMQRALGAKLGMFGPREEL